MLLLRLQQVAIHRIDCNLEFGRIKLLESKAINDSKLDRGNNTPSTSVDDLVVKDQLANDGKVRAIE